MSKPANQLKVFLGVLLLGGIAGLPLMNKKVYEREQAVHRMRDESYDALDKNAARNARLSRGSS